MDMQPDTLTPGQLLARGTCRHLRRAHDFTCVEEMTLKTRLRVDVMAIGPKGEIWVVECKSGLADYRADSKWEGYLDYCDRYFWAVDSDFPTEILPAETGLIIADGYDAEILRMGPESKLAGARRKALTLRLARTAMTRLHGFRDGDFGGR
ncbi:MULTISPECIES: MmcB family DNA repair protein [unclassified Meridianimarinicoccus]|uniref:MmcB family DNA repair protein n=1 Tax=unclassified Meridianimarinicoccus TaxID=2923344 RepID=UPI001866B96C|nr:MmcB family DNA repair protein [Fluviibacterium sp. MJW13]